MRLLLSILLLLTVAFTGSSRRALLFKRDAAGAAHNHPASPLLFEDFEAAPGYDLAGWAEYIVNGSIDEDYTGTVLFGSQSCQINQAIDDPTSTTNSFAATDRVFVSFLLRVTALDAGGVDKTILRLLEDDGTCLMQITVNGDSEFKVWANCTDSATISQTFSLDTTYYCWAEWDKDNGANSYANFGFSTTGVRPTAGSQFAEVTATSMTEDASQVLLGSLNDEGAMISFTYIVDHLLVDDVQIGDYP